MILEEVKVMRGIIQAKNTAGLRPEEASQLLHLSVKKISNLYLSMAYECVSKKEYQKVKALFIKSLLTKICLIYFLYDQHEMGVQSNENNHLDKDLDWEMIKAYFSSRLIDKNIFNPEYFKNFTLEVLNKDDLQKLEAFLEKLVSKEKLNSNAMTAASAALPIPNDDSDEETDQEMRALIIH
jgi:hypothetical protein